MAKQPADSKQLKNAVKDATEKAENAAQTGNVATVKESAKQPDESLPTGTRRGQPAE